MLGWGRGDANISCTCTHVGCYSNSIAPLTRAPLCCWMCGDCCSWQHSVNKFWIDLGQSIYAKFPAQPEFAPKAAETEAACSWDEPEDTSTSLHMRIRCWVFGFCLCQSSITISECFWYCLMSSHVSCLWRFQAVAVTTEAAWQPKLQQNTSSRL